MAIYDQKKPYDPYIFFIKAVRSDLEDQMYCSLRVATFHFLQFQDWLFFFFFFFTPSSMCPIKKSTANDCYFLCDSSTSSRYQTCVVFMLCHFRLQVFRFFKVRIVQDTNPEIFWQNSLQIH